MYNKDKTASELWAVVNEDCDIMYSRGGSSSTPHLMVYPSRKKAEAAIKNTWTKQIIPDPSMVQVVQIYHKPINDEVSKLAINVGHLTKLLVEHGVSCDTCDSQEDSHYCLLHTKQIKNMNLYCCDDWTTK